MRTFLSILFLSLVFTGQLYAKDALLITPQKTWDLVQKQGDSVLFVDVRDPVEIFFVGFTDVVDANIPFRLVDRSRFIVKRSMFAMDINPDFVSDIEQALQAKGLGRDALIITMCRSGSHRGKPSAEYLLARGFSNVKYIDHGFQGSKSKQGKLKDRRVINGWQNSGLPWSTGVNPEKIYRK